MNIRTINVTFGVNEEALKKAVDMEDYNFEDAINQELGWLHDSGISAVTWKEEEE